MNCRRARNLLTRTADREAAADPALARHLADCAQCERFATRWTAVRRGIEGRLARVTPDAGFAARVTARLAAPADPFTWAARRLLPVTLALTLALGGWCVLRTPAPSSLAEQLADGDLLVWMASDAGEPQ